ncbi:DUF1983 domain-containing protein [Acerihabitans sp. KWT182]|uniref:DUF1983 domain-containing protein n=1 Tax=Acerihabitans sp. KWT182 TaxID=3157919 RepID=A0AAU7QFL0_9GAMM
MIKGRKGGSSSSSTPTESPDSIQSIARAKILVALGEGELAGGLDGTSIFLGDGSTTTALSNADGSLNFTGVTWDFRPGTQAQDFIAGLPAVEDEIAIGITLSSASPWVRAISDTDLTAVRIRLGWPTLQQEQSNGDVTGYRIEYAIDLATDGGAYQQIIDTAVDGKTTTLYERSHRIDLPTAITGWQIRVRRITADSTSSMIADTMNIEAITEVIDAKLRYPNTALLYVEFDAEQFTNIPKISCKPQGRIIRVPDTYDPVARTYTGTWTGTFKWAYSNNPAWVFYDLVLSNVFGLGNRIDSTQIDETALYQIAQYCDQLVPDGLGGSGTEPRFLCDVYIQSQEDAWTVLTDLAAIFRGMTYWGQNQLVALADMPRDLDYTITRANVVNGKFTYSSSSEKTIYTTAMVSYGDPDNHYADIIEPVSDNDLVQRYGINQTDITAIGCVRRSEANRRGRWALLSNVKNRVVDFSMGLDAIIPLPGRIIGIADQNLAGKITGGRISAVDGRNITLDRVADVLAGDRLILNLPSGVAQARTVQAVNDKIATVTTAYSETPVTQAVWAIDSDTLAIQQYRVTQVSDNGDGTYAITGTQYDESKYAAIDTGARLDSRPVSVIPPGVQAPPADVAIDSYTAISQGLAVTTLRVTWQSAANAIAYEAQWRRDSGNWISAARTSALGFEVPGIYAGTYQARVCAINASDISSVWANADETQLSGKTGAPPKPLGFSATTDIVFGITLTWGFPEGTDDTLETEIQYSPSSDGTGAILLADVPYPQSTYQQMGLAAGVTYWYRAQLIDRTGNESGFTDWVEGSSSNDASAILDAIGADIMTTEAGQELAAQIDTNTDALVATALANHANVLQQWANYGDNRAGIISMQTTIADDQQSLAAYQQDVTARFNNDEATIETKATSMFNASGDGYAVYDINAGVTYNGQYFAAGMAIGAQVSGGVVTTQVLFQADRFAFMDQSNGVVSTPFAIQNGQTFINAGFIADASITNAKIGNYIQSTNYVAGSAGWYIGKDGTAEFSNATVRGNITADSGTLNNVVINNNCTIKGILAANQVTGGIATSESMDLSGISDPNGNATHTQSFYRTLYANSYVNRVLTIVGPMAIDAGTSTGSLTVEIFANNVSIGSATIATSSVNDNAISANGAFGASVNVPVGTQVDIRILVTKVNRGTMLAGPALLTACVDTGTDWSAQT